MRSDVLKINHGHIKKLSNPKNPLLKSDETVLESKRLVEWKVNKFITMQHVLSISDLCYKNALLMLQGLFQHIKSCKWL